MRVFWVLWLYTNLFWGWYYISCCFLRSIGQVLNIVEDHAFIFRVIELEIGVCWSDREEVMCWLCGKVARIVASQSYEKGREDRYSTELLGIESLWWETHENKWLITDRNMKIVCDIHVWCFALCCSSLLEDGEWKVLLIWAPVR